MATDSVSFLYILSIATTGRGAEETPNTLLPEPFGQYHSPRGFVTAIQQTLCICVRATPQLAFVPHDRPTHATLDHAKEYGLHSTIELVIFYALISSLDISEDSFLDSCVHEEDVVLGRSGNSISRRLDKCHSASLRIRIQTPLLDRYDYTLVPEDEKVLYETGEYPVVVSRSSPGSWRTSAMKNLRWQPDRTVQPVQ